MMMMLARFRNWWRWVSMVMARYRNWWRVSTPVGTARVGQQPARSQQAGQGAATAAGAGGRGAARCSGIVLKAIRGVVRASKTLKL